MQKGRLIKWNDAKGFGFIRDETDGADIFCHISAFGRQERRPLVGDSVNFQIVSDANGRKRAASANIDGVKSVFSESRLELARQSPRPPLRRSTNPERRSRSTATLTHIVLRWAKIGVFLAFGLAIVKMATRNPTLPEYLDAEVIQESNNSIPEDLNTEVPPKSISTISKDFRTELPLESIRPIKAISTKNEQFKCAGKNRCTQMTSCAEAMFYLNHCPGSLTDGDGDGRPCEDQWCGH